MTYDVYLAHHGILGMKWGVRRYQNADGSYTAAGRQRYGIAEKKYKESKETLTGLKKSGASRKEISTASKRVRKNKKNLSIAYDNLKRDYKADQGKELYRRGQTITSNNSKSSWASILSVSASVLGASAAAKRGSVLITKYGPIPLSSIIFTGGMATASVYDFVQQYRNKKLRAYYGHSHKAYL